MRSTSNKLALLCIFLFASFVGNAQLKINRLNYRAFNYENKVEGDISKGNFVEMNDGKKIYGEKVSWKDGMFSKAEVILDGEKYLLKDVKGYQKDGVFYARFEKILIQRIVKGKINVYVQFMRTFYDGKPSVSIVHYIQKHDGQIEFLASLEEAAESLAECSLSVSMLSVSSSEFRKERRKNPNYVNDAFEIYNNDCKAVR